MKYIMFVGFVASILNCAFQIYFAVDQKYHPGFVGAIGWFLVAGYQFMSFITYN